MHYSNIKKCRVCESDSIFPILNLGDQPLANALKKKQSEPELKIPLSLCYCSNCSLIQLKETVKKETLFSDYIWVTGTSMAVKSYVNTFYERAIKIANPKKGDFILEIASNDGTFLHPFNKNGFSILGVEPAANIAEIANSNGLNTITSFWSEQTSNEVLAKYGKAKIVFARNVIPHVSELHSVIAGIKHSLANDGTGIIEFHNAGEILKELHYDSIYHEHLCYFSIKSIF